MKELDSRVGLKNDCGCSTGFDKYMVPKILALLIYE